MFISKKRCQQLVSNWVNNLESSSSSTLPSELEFLAPQLQQLMNKMDDFKSQVETMKTDSDRLHQYATSAGAGLWDLKLFNGDPAHPNTESFYTKRFRELIGYANENDFPNTGDAWAKVLHPDDTNGVFSAFNAHLSDRTGNTPYNHEFRMKTKQGNYRWFNVQGACIRNNVGVAEFASGSVIDIHESKMSQLDKAESDERRNILINDVSEVVQQVSGAMHSSSAELEGTKHKMAETYRVLMLVMIP